MKKLIRQTMAAFALLVAGAAGAEAVSEAQARTVAENFIAQDGIGLGVLPGRTVDAVTRRGSLWLVALKPSGCLLVGGNRSAEPIYTFSANDFTEPEAGSPQEAVLARLEKLAANATGSDNASRWQRILGEGRTLTASRLSVSSASAAVNITPLVESNWGQTYPFNGLTPVIKKSHTPVGCVATAYDQIMRYWEWPAVLDADIVTEHTVDNAWGLKWLLPAGTDFEWASSPLDAKTFDNPTCLRMARQAVFAGMIAKMDYNTQSGAQTGQPGVNRWYTPYTCLDDSNSTLAKREAAMIESLQKGCPFMVSVTYGGSGHAVVGDGWMTSTVDGSGWVHLNYGWQSTDSTTYYRPVSAEGVYLYQKPRPMVLNRPIRTRSTLPVSLAWAFPTKGYTDSLKDFAISYTEVSGTETDWSDDLSNPKGTLEGARITTATVANWNGGDVLRIDTRADEAYYTWPTVVATAATKLSYDVHSNNARGMLVQVQLFDPATGWATVDTPEISENGESDWTKRTVDLAAYDGKGIAVRIYATRPSGSSSYVVSDAAGVHFDNVTLTRVREAASTALGETIVAGSLRAASVSDAKLTTGKTYLFSVTPRFNDATEGIPGHAQSCMIVGESVAQPTITSVSSVTSDAPKFGTDGMQRNAFLGLNQIGVYGTAAMTDLTAELNVKSLVDWGLEEDAVVPGTYITAAKAVSVADAVEVEKKSDGNFLVRVDASGLSENVLTTEMILTLRGYNSVGDVCQKDVCLYFNMMGSETRIDVKDLPENGGTVVIPDPEEPEPEEPESADPEPYEPEPEEPVPDEPVQEEPVDSGESDEPAEEVPVVTPTFPKAYGAGPNDDAAAKTRFCPGVTATSGWHDVNKTGTYGYIAPGPQDLVKWWVERYTTVKGSAPAGYAATADSAIASSDSGIDYLGYLGTLLSGCSAATGYFPAGTSALSAYQIYSALANGPIGFKVSGKSTYYGAIWGCTYGADAAGNYAATIHFTSSKSKNDGLESKTLTRSGDRLEIAGYGGDGTDAVFDFFYPVSAPEPESSGGGAVMVKVTAGGREFDISKAFSKVEKGADGAVTYTLDANARVKVTDGDDVDEEIPVQPELAADGDERPFEVKDGKLVFTVKSIPGLKYQVLASDSLAPDSFEPAGQEREATGTRRELTVTRSGETRGFYKIRVSR